MSLGKVMSRTPKKLEKVRESYGNKGMYISRYNQSFNAKSDSGLYLSSFTLFLSLFLLTF
jgi:hypothetical protein